MNTIDKKYCVLLLVPNMCAQHVLRMQTDTNYPNPLSYPHGCGYGYRNFLSIGYEYRIWVLDLQIYYNADQDMDIWLMNDSVS